MHSDAIKSLDPLDIKKSFKITGYNLNLDGSENESLSTSLRDIESEFIFLYLNQRVNKSDIDHELYDWINDLADYNQGIHSNIEIDSVEIDNNIKNLEENSQNEPLFYESSSNDDSF